MEKVQALLKTFEDFSALPIFENQSFLSLNTCEYAASAEINGLTIQKYLESGQQGVFPGGFVSRICTKYGRFDLTQRETEARERARVILRQLFLHKEANLNDFFENAIHQEIALAIKPMIKKQVFWCGIGYALRDETAEYDIKLKLSGFDYENHFKGSFYSASSAPVDVWILYLHGYLAHSDQDKRKLWDALCEDYTEVNLMNFMDIFIVQMFHLSRLIFIPCLKGCIERNSYIGSA